MKFSKFKLLIASFLLLICCQGCSFIFFPYFRNLSSETVTVIFESAEELDGYNSFKYTASIIPIQKDISKKLKDSLPIETDANNRHIIKIPARSTVLIPNRLTRPESMMIIQQGNRVDTFNMSNIDTVPIFKCVRKGFPVKYICYYDYDN